MVMPYQNNTFSAAYRLLGQDRYEVSSPNLIEGREFQFFNSTAANAGLALGYTRR